MFTYWLVLPQFIFKNSLYRMWYNLLYIVIFFCHLEKERKFYRPVLHYLTIFIFQQGKRFTNVEDGHIFWFQMFWRRQYSGTWYGYFPKSLVLLLSSFFGGKYCMIVPPSIINKLAFYFHIPLLTRKRRTFDIFLYHVEVTQYILVVSNFAVIKVKGISSYCMYIYIYIYFYGVLNNYPEFKVHIS